MTKNIVRSGQKDQEVHQRQEMIKKTRKDPAHMRRIQRHQEHFEHQLGEEKDTHPKEKMKKAMSSHQEKELPMSLGDSVANCMLATNVTKQCGKPTQREKMIMEIKVLVWK